MPLRTLLVHTPINFFIANKYIDNILLRPFALLFGGFPAKDHKKRGWGMKEARKRLKDGPVMIFPEGKFTRYKGQHEPKWGVASLAKDEDVLILPVKIIRTKKSIFRSFEITYAEPQKLAGRTPKEIMDIIYKL